jgi:glycosyltransferase involved in cell wall biosynthesis
VEKKRIIWLIDVLGRGGAERLMVPLMQHIDTERFLTRVCVLRERYGNPVAEELKRMGVTVDMLPVNRLRDLTAIPRMVRYFRRHEADLVHTQLEFANALGNAAASIIRLPSVCTIHTLDDPVEGSKKSRRLKLMWWSLRRFCDQVITVSEGARRHYLAVSGDSVDKVITVYNGIDLSSFPQLDTAQQAALRESLGIPAHVPLMITVAVLRPQKGIQYMLEALPAILETVPDAYYMVVGDGDHRQALQESARRSGLGERVIFTGFREDVASLLSISDLFVLPTLDEALPTVLAEAMAMSLPLVVSDVGGVSEMVDDGVNGLLLPPGDPDRLAEACIGLLQNDEDAHQMGEAGWKVVNERFNIRKQVKLLGDLYDEILGSSVG